MGMLPGWYKDRSLPRKRKHSDAIDFKQQHPASDDTKSAHTKKTKLYRE